MSFSKRAGRAALALSSLAFSASCADTPRAITEDPSSGFALYRSGRLSPADLGVLCGLGVEEILVLDGEGGERECRLAKTLCPGLRVRYDHAQEEDRPVSTDFLQAFDAWMEEAQAKGRKVAFRCRHGWHRTGRLAAYYRIRFEGASAAVAKDEMQRIGRMMWRHPTLDPQVEAYEDLVAERPCSTDPAHCPVSEPDAGLLDGHFPDDACSVR
jgi:hypothetical protein